MSQLQEQDRVATRGEVHQHGAQLRKLLASHGLANPRLRGDGAVVVTAPSYRGVAEATVPAAELVGAHVRIVLDTAPSVDAAGPDLPLL